MANDTWRTPPEIFEYYNVCHNFKFDVCASSDNALCKNFLTENDDYLAFDLSTMVRPGDYVWLNPPYSKPLPFVQKAINDSQLYGIGCVLLLNHDMSTKWARLLCLHDVTHHIFLLKRVSFLNDQGLAVNGNSKGQFVVIIPPFVRYGDPKVEYIKLETIMTIGSKYLKERAA